MEQIKAITEITEGEGWDVMSGYEVITDQQRITLLIDDQASCCERFGYFWCNDDLQEFVGSDLREITITDTALNEVYMRQNEVDPNDKWFWGGVMFVNLETSEGTLQFVAYNEHNGYYGHEATVRSKQLEHREIL